MAPPPDHNHAVRKVVLPSGKTIEIVYFADDEPAAGRQSDALHQGELHHCPECSSNLVYSTAWGEAGDQAWELALHCPNCDWTHTGVFAQRDVDKLDEQLDQGTQVLVHDLKHLMHANMEAELERFAAALHAGHIWPMDF